MAGTFPDAESACGRVHRVRLCVAGSCGVLQSRCLAGNLGECRHSIFARWRDSESEREAGSQGASMIAALLLGLLQAQLYTVGGTVVRGASSDPLAKTRVFLQ